MKNFPGFLASELQLWPAARRPPEQSAGVNHASLATGDTASSLQILIGRQKLASDSVKIQFMTQSEFDLMITDPEEMDKKRVRT
jgi:hypothetical protein